MSSIAARIARRARPGAPTHVTPLARRSLASSSHRAWQSRALAAAANHGNEGTCGWSKYGIAGLTLGVGAVATCEEEEQVEEDGEEMDRMVGKRVWEFEEIQGNYSGVFLSKAAREMLRERFPPMHKNEKYDHMTIEFEPSKDTVLDDDDLFNEESSIHVIGHAADEHCQVLLVVLANPHVQSKNKFAHITLSNDQESGEQYASKYSNVLFHRLACEMGGKNAFFLRKNETGKTWQGELPAAGTYAKTTGKYDNVEEEAIVVTGTYCLANKWDGETCTYERENECSFCKFMKGGPCRKQFIVWEKCVAKTPTDGEEEDFVDRCASHTLVLKDCVDANPDYYYILGDDAKTETQGDEQEQEKQE
uniref:GCK domain-containing protein n=1 Tax=Mucochytrium quahogii TaxID=96639 RepID=A0A7S2SHB2_9STRA|mmetsp:Transcript_6970/g.11050  ORF Transcript_6970/g.11050 Transcript_6970/m.11050 type:complete len:363 (+) Transcript_6970:860-1948(+)